MSFIKKKLFSYIHLHSITSFNIQSKHSVIRNHKEAIMSCGGDTSSRCSNSIDSLDSLTIYPYQSLLLVSLEDSTQCPHRADDCKFFSGWPTALCSCVGVHMRTLLMYLSLFILHVLLVILGQTATVLQGAASRMCLKQHTASTFYSNHFIRVQEVLSYSSTDTTTARKNSSLILSKRLDFYIVNDVSIAVLP